MAKTFKLLGAICESDERTKKYMELIESKSVRSRNERASEYASVMFTRAKILIKATEIAG
jgi:hypothetical protein